MRSLRNHVGNHARAYAGLGGFLVFLAGLLGTGLLVGQQQAGELQALQQRTAERTQALAQDANRMLEELNRDHVPDCSPENLARLRGVLFGTRYQRDIGLYDDQGRLYCTTSIGPLRVPVRMGPPNAESIVDGMPVRTWFNLRLAVGGGRYRATVMQRGPFNTVVDPIATSEVVQMGVHFIWYRRPDGPLVPVRSNAAAKDGLREYMEAIARDGQPYRGYSWRHGAFVDSMPAPGTRLMVQSYATLETAVSAHAHLILLLGSLSALLGLLYYAAALPRLAGMARLDHRIAALVKPEHVLCVYQPVIDLHSGQTVGCEVLMRLRDGKETLFPDVAIPAIMRKGLTWQLDQAVIERGLSELAQQLPPGRPLKVSFNLFPENIRFEQVHALLSRHLQALGRPELQIALEVIEQDYDVGVIEQVGRLRQAGYLVSVDDFGTGFSNLGSVKKFSPSFLKIDKSFVFDMEDASVRSSLIPEIVAIARAVDAQVIAEGVENTAQAERLKACGVQFGQGYLFARPLPIEQFVRFLADSDAARAQPERPGAAWPQEVLLQGSA